MCFPRPLAESFASFLRAIVDGNVLQTRRALAGDAVHASCRTGVASNLLRRSSIEASDVPLFLILRAFTLVFFLLAGGRQKRVPDRGPLRWECPGAETQFGCGGAAPVRL